jgi:hypothetical protein
MRTKIGASSTNFHALDLFFADRTRMALFPIDSMECLEFSWAGCGIHIVTDRRSFVFYSLFQDFSHLHPQPSQIRFFEQTSREQRIKLCSKKNFICINISNSRNKMLVQKQALQSCFSPVEEGNKVCQLYLERLRA